MGGLPPDLLTIISVFAPLFTETVWQRAQILLTGALLTPGQRTVTALLRTMGLSEERRFKNYPRVLSRACWSGLASSRLLLSLLIQTFVPSGPLVMGLDDTIERRWGGKIRARGIYRDSVRSSRGHFVKASGLRFVVVADSSFAVLELLAAVSSHTLSVITRLRLDAALYEPAPEPVVGQRGRRRKKGQRLPTLAQGLINSDTRWQRITVAQWYGEKNRTVEITSATAVWYHSGLPVVPIRWVLIRDPKQRFKPQALLSTDPNAPAEQIVQWFVQRWQVEVTFQQVRAHLGVETQRQWSDKAIARTTPLLLALFSLVTLMANRLIERQAIPVRAAAWYQKSHPSFSDALALVRRQLWANEFFQTSRSRTDWEKSSDPVVARLTEILCYAA